MANLFDPSPEQVRDWESWVAGRPEPVRLVAARFKPWKLYRLKNGHRVTLVSFAETADGRVTLTVSVTGEFNFVVFERDVFGIDPDELEECERPAPGEPVGVADTTLVAPPTGPSIIGGLSSLMLFPMAHVRNRSSFCTRRSCVDLGNLEVHLRQALENAFLGAAKELPSMLAPDPAGGLQQPPGALTPTDWRHQVIHIVKNVLAPLGLDHGSDVGAICASCCGIRLEKGQVWVNVDGIIEAILRTSTCMRPADAGPDA